MCRNLRSTTNFLAATAWRYDGVGMKIPPPIDFPEGGTPAERLDRAFRKVLTVPMEAILKEQAHQKQRREKRRAKKPH